LSIITGNRLDDIVRHICEDGYFLIDGDLSQTCQENNTWSGQAPICKSMINFTSIV